MELENMRVMFLRDLTGKPVGCLAIRADRNKGLVSYQLSVLNPSDNFDRKVARQLALGRLIEAPKRVKIAKSATMHDISKAVMEGLLRDKSAPARALKSAKNWLTTNCVSDY